MLAVESRCVVDLFVIIERVKYKNLAQFYC